MYFTIAYKLSDFAIMKSYSAACIVLTNCLSVYYY